MTIMFVLEYVGHVIIQSIKNPGFEFSLGVNYNKNILMHRIHLCFSHGIT
jgi:hypothetical protein